MSTEAAYNTVSPSGSDIHWRVAGTGDVPALLLSGSQDERARACIFNHSNAGLYIRFGGAANLKVSGSSPSFDLRIASGTLYELPRPIWQGEVWGAWDATGGWAMISETGDND
jgi:hypothetical protein